MSDKTKKSELLGSVLSSSTVRSDKIAPFNAEKVLRTLKANIDRLLVPLYCSDCGEISYIDICNINFFMGEETEFPAYEIGLYVELKGCAECGDGEIKKPVIKKFNIP
jgi:hypothetical protein